jgi:lipoprotein-releasing system permease protein
LNFPFYIAKRYLISKKKRNAINIISFISVLGVAVGTAALIIVLSVFNGFDNLLRKLYNSFDPDIKIVAAEGKTFLPDDKLLETLDNSNLISLYSLCLEENAMLQYGEKQIIGTIKGVDENYELVTGIDSMIKIGNYSLYYDNIPLAVPGQGIAFNLGVDFDFLSPVSVYIPSRTKEFKGNFQDAADNLNISKVYVSGTFSIQQEYDTKYFIMPLPEVRKLLEYDKNVSSIEIKLKPGIKDTDARKILENELGNKFKILDRELQHEYAYKIMKSEKWVIFMILALILLVASFNIIGSLTMLIIDKKKDISILKSLGADNKTIRNIFFLEGLFISFCGAVTGLLIGSFVCWLQIEFGLLKLGNEGSFIISNYPVIMIWSDFIYIFIVVMLIGVFAAWYPVRYITKRFADVEY